jgi:hypothetical protein
VNKIISVSNVRALSVAYAAGLFGARHVSWKSLPNFEKHSVGKARRHSPRLRPSRTIGLRRHLAPQVHPRVRERASRKFEKAFVFLGGWIVVSL